VGSALLFNGNPSEVYAKEEIMGLVIGVLVIVVLVLVIMRLK
jgi:hypothetical protein